MAFYKQTQFIDAAHSTHDLIPYKGVIKRHLKYHSSPKLDSMLAKALPNVRKPLPFLIKMEIKKLAKPHQLPIDLRPHTNNDVHPIKYQGMVHHLDAPGLEIFKEGLKTFSGQYTLAIYQDCISDAIERKNSDSKIATVGQHSSIPLQKNKGPEPFNPKLDLIRLNEYPIRQDERVIHKSQLVVLDGPKPIVGECVDLSLSGLKATFRTSEIKQITLKKGSDLHIRMSGLESEFLLSEPLYLTFQLQKIFQAGNFLHLAMSLKDEGDTKDYRQVIKRLLSKENGKPEVNTINTEIAALTKGFEQFHMSKLGAVPILLKRSGEQFVPIAELKSSETLLLADYWRCDDGIEQWPSILLQPEVQEKIRSNVVRTAYFFVVKYQSTHGTQFYVAESHKRLFNKSELALLEVGRQLGTLKVIKFSFHPISPKDAIVKQALPTRYQSKLFSDLPQETAKRIKDVECLAVMSDVTNAMEPWSKGKWQVTKAQLSHFKELLLKKYTKHDIEEDKIESSEFRSEDRFELNLPAKISIGEHTLSANTVNVSGQGMAIELTKPIKILQKGTQLKVTLPQQNLTELPYKVMGVDSPRNLRLMIAGSPRRHEGRQYFSNYIYRNSYELKASGVENEVFGMSRAIRNIYAKHHAGCPVFLSSDKNQMRAAAVAISDDQCVLPKELAPVKNVGAQCEVLTDVFNTPHGLEAWNKLAQSEGTEDPPTYVLLFIHKQVNKELVCRISTDFQTSQALQRYLKAAHNSGELVCWLINCNQRGSIFFKYVQDELRYLKTYADERYEKIVKRIKRISHVACIEDVTYLVEQLLLSSNVFDHNSQ